MTIASTLWLMKLRTAEICASCLLSAALKISSKPFSFEKAFFIDSVFAARQPDSDPVCAKPTLIRSPPPPLPPAPGAVLPAQPVATSASAPSMAAAAKTVFFIPKPPCSGPAHRRCSGPPWPSVARMLAFTFLAALDCER